MPVRKQTPPGMRPLPTRWNCPVGPGWPAAAGIAEEASRPLLAGRKSVAPVGGAAVGLAGANSAFGCSTGRAAFALRPFVILIRNVAAVMLRMSRIRTSMAAIDELPCSRCDQQPALRGPRNGQTVVAVGVGDGATWATRASSVSSRPSIC